MTNNSLFSGPIEIVQVLLIEDNPGDARLIQELLSEAQTITFVVEHADWLSGGLARLAQGGIDAVLLDLSLPDSQGLETLEALRSQEPDVPVLVLTGLDDERTGLKAVRRGAQEYLVKGQTEAALLIRSIAYAVERKQAEGAHRAKEAAEAANRAKSEFLSRMSHELRTPLNAILGFAQLMEMDSASLDPGQKESLGYILKAGRHLLGLINEVLDISSIEDGRLTLSSEPVSMGELLYESIELVKPLAAENNVRIVSESLGQQNVRQVMADRQNLKKVMHNLLSNAVKYNRQGGSVTVTCEEQTDGEYLRVMVNDTGPGIQAEDMERLFTPFDRLGAERGSAEGTGLGLALSKRLVEAMGGAIGVESVVGKGSTFWVGLPLMPRD